MTKRELIDAIADINPTAMPEFLARFSDLALREYYEHLYAAQRPRQAATRERYEQYFSEPPTQASPPSAMVAVEHVAADLDDTDDELTAAIAARAHRTASRLLDAAGASADAESILFCAEDFDDPAPVNPHATCAHDPYPLELDDLTADDPMADIGLSPRKHAPRSLRAEPIGAGRRPLMKQTINCLDALKQERALLF
jgi:hypothetical protein